MYVKEEGLWEDEEVVVLGVVFCGVFYMSKMFYAWNHTMSSEMYNIFSISSPISLHEFNQNYYIARTLYWTNPLFTFVG